MSEVVGDSFIISHEKPQQCDFCNKIAKLRPYGPNEECICFECMMKNQTMSALQFLKRVGDKVVYKDGKIVEKNSNHKG